MALAQMVGSRLKDSRSPRKPVGLIDQPGQDQASATGGFGCFRNDVVFNPSENLEEGISIELEASDILFDRSGDAVDRDEERELPFTESVEQFFVTGCDTKDRVPISDQLHFREMGIHFCVATQIIPGSPHPLDRHAVVEQASHDPEGHQISE